MNAVEISKINKSLESLADDLSTEVLNFLENLKRKSSTQDLLLTDHQKEILDQRRIEFNNLPSYSIEEIKNLRPI